MSRSLYQPRNVGIILYSKVEQLRTNTMNMTDINDHIMHTWVTTMIDFSHVKR